jgi:hypothetical protein
VGLTGDGLDHICRVSMGRYANGARCCYRPISSGEPVSDRKQTRRLDDVPDDEDMEELNFRDQTIVAADRVLPITSTVPPPPPAPKSDS